MEMVVPVEGYTLTRSNSTDKLYNEAVIDVANERNIDSTKKKYIGISRDTHIITSDSTTASSASINEEHVTSTQSLARSATFFNCKQCHWNCQQQYHAY